MESLEQIQVTLKAALGSDALYGLVNTRITLRTGIDLNGIEQEVNRSPEAVARVLEVLSALGYSPSALQLVANKRNK